MSLDEAQTRALISRSLEDDLAFGPDITSLATVSDAGVSTATVGARQHGVVAALDVLNWALPDFTVSHVPDGTSVSPGSVVATVTGPTLELLTAERTILNMICHASGIATETARWVSAVSGTGAQIRDTRKTLPGLRNLQKYAVSVGGGTNHRMGLGDEALIKDNHVAAAGGVVQALEKVRATYPSARVEVEVDTLEQFREVLPLAPDEILLDNFSVAEVTEAVSLRNFSDSPVRLEASGGLNLDVAHAYASTGVDFLAVGALTHSVRVLDLGLDF